MKGIRILIKHGDAIHVDGDVLVLKYAQSSYGLDRDIEREFALQGKPISNELPTIGKVYLTSSNDITSTKSLLFIGVPQLSEFGYKEIRDFGRKTLSSLYEHKDPAKTLLMTIHGPGFGLDELEAFKSQLAGMLDSISAEQYPEDLEEIIFVERSKSRADRLNKVLVDLFPIYEIPTTRSGGIKKLDEKSAETLRGVGYNSASKKKIFVAMPFAADFDDLFYYGIQGAVNSCGYLCERADLQSFVGDVMEFVKERIATCDFVIADLTTANANVYLEVGYAWGLQKKTILIVKDTNELKFDVRGQRCIPYSAIKDLETKLSEELKRLNL